jgi:hypothetical protein
MVKELHQNLQTFVAGEFFVKITVRLFSFGETAKFLCRLFREMNISLAAAFSERI